MPAAAEGSDGALKEVCVRYFLRLTAYTGFDSEARRWNAQEVVLYRGRLHGRPVPPSKLPRKVRNGTLAAAPTGSAPSAPAASPVFSASPATPAAGSSTSSASAAVLPPSVPLPQPMTTPFAATLLFGRGGGGSAAGGTTPRTPGGVRGAPLSPALTPYVTARGGASSMQGSPRPGFSVAAPADFDAEAGGLDDDSLDAGGANLSNFLTKAVRINDVTSGQ